MFLYFLFYWFQLFLLFFLCRFRFSSGKNSNSERDFYDAKEKDLFKGITYTKKPQPNPEKIGNTNGSEYTQRIDKGLKVSSDPTCMCVSVKRVRRFYHMFPGTHD